MARYRWRYDKDGNAHEITWSEPSTPTGPYVMGDIQPYRSMADGTMVEGRRQHREMLKRNNCVEIGNEKQTPRPVMPPTGLKETLIQVAQEKLRYR